MKFSQVVTEALARLGRGRDSLIAHVAPGEIVLPASYLDKHPELKEMLAAEGWDIDSRIVGNPKGKVNPHTGLQEFDDGDGGDGGDGGTGGDNTGGDTTGGDTAGGETSASDAAAADATSAEGGTPGTAGMSEGLGAGDTGIGPGETGASESFGMTGAESFGDPTTEDNDSGGGTADFAGNLLGKSDIDQAILASVMRRQGRYVTYSDRTKEEVAAAQEADLAYIKSYDDPLTTRIEEPPDRSDYSFFGSGMLYEREQDRKEEESERIARESKANPFAYAGGIDRLFATQDYNGGFGNLFG